MRGKSVGSSVRIGLIGALLGLWLAQAGNGQQAQHPTEACCAAPRHEAATTAGGAAAHLASPGLSPTELFGARAQMILGTGQPAKGDWGLLVADAGTGQVLFEENADKFFVPASNMKLFTTALALSKLGLSAVEAAQVSVLPWSRQRAEEQVEGLPAPSGPGASLRSPPPCRKLCSCRMNARSRSSPLCTQRPARPTPAPPPKPAFLARSRRPCANIPANRECRGFRQWRNCPRRDCARDSGPEWDIRS